MGSCSVCGSHSSTPRYLQPVAEFLPGVVLVPADAVAVSAVLWERDAFTLVAHGAVQMCSRSRSDSVGSSAMSSLQPGDVSWSRSPLAAWSRVSRVGYRPSAQTLVLRRSGLIGVLCPSVPQFPLAVPPAPRGAEPRQPLCKRGGLK